MTEFYVSQQSLSKQEVIIGPNNRVASSDDDFLRVNLIGDYAGYTDIPSFDNFYLVIPRQVFSSTSYLLKTNEK